MRSYHTQAGNARSVLSIHPGAVGDVFLSRPSLNRLRRRFPEHEIALLATTAVASLLYEAGEIDRVFPLESTHLAELFAGSRCVNAPFRKWLQTCDLAVGWLQDAEAAIADSLQALGVQSVRIQSPSSPGLLSEHQAARYLEALEGESVNLMEGDPLVLSSSTREEGRQLLETLKWSRRQRLVVLHVGSGSIHKCLGASQWAALLAWLHREGAFPLMLEGPSDDELVARVQATLGRSVPVLRDHTLSAVAGVLSHADCYLGHDSGVTHLAAALSIPTIACFGPTNPRRWAPLGPSVAILTGPSCSCPDWNSVERCREKVCLNISSERIIEVCSNFLKR